MGGIWERLWIENEEQKMKKIIRKRKEWGRIEIVERQTKMKKESEKETLNWEWNRNEKERVIKKGKNEGKK